MSGFGCNSIFPGKPELTGSFHVNRSPSVKGVSSIHEGTSAGGGILMNFLPEAEYGPGLHFKDADLGSTRVFPVFFKKSFYKTTDQGYCVCLQNVPGGGLTHGIF